MTTKRTVVIGFGELYDLACKVILEDKIYKISRAATLRVGDKISTLQVATGAGAMIGHLSAMLFPFPRAIRWRWIKISKKITIMFAYMNKKQYLCAKL
jgi:hypothetical protein